MDKIISARIDEAVVGQIGILARERNTSKKSIIEAAVSAYTKILKKQHPLDTFDHTFGVWQREESAEVSKQKSHDAFNCNFSRHQQNRH